MIEGVKCLKPQPALQPFPNSNIFEQAQVNILIAWSYDRAILLISRSACGDCRIKSSRIEPLIKCMGGILIGVRDVIRSSSSSRRASR